MQIQQERERPRKQRTKRDFPRSICSPCHYSGQVGCAVTVVSVNTFFLPNLFYNWTQRRHAIDEHHYHCHYNSERHCSLSLSFKSFSSQSPLSHHYKNVFLPQIRTNLTAKSRQPTDVLRRLTIAVELSH